MKIGFILIILFSVITAGVSQPELKIYGTLQGIMHQNDTSEKVRLNLMGPIFNYYGLGAVAGLDGEILILNGETHVTRVLGGSIVTDKSTDVGAALLVIAQVHEWDTLTIDLDITSLNDLESFIEERHHYMKAFPFLILTMKSDIQWHVIRSPKNDAEMNDHNSLGIEGKYKGVANILGFYSKVHQGIFTHSNSNVHMHFLSKDGLYSGHVDEIELGIGAKLLIPRRN